MTYLLTYKSSQNHLKLRLVLFVVEEDTTIIILVGNLKQAAAYKRILIHNQVVGSVYGNCTILDKTKNYIETSTSTDYISFVGGFIENINFYVAGFVARSVA